MHAWQAALSIKLTGPAAASEIATSAAHAAGAMPSAPAPSAHPSASALPAPGSIASSPASDASSTDVCAAASWQANTGLRSLIPF